MSKKVRVPVTLPNPHYKIIHYLVEHTDNLSYLSPQAIYAAAQQACAIWAAVTPVIFLRRGYYANGDVHIALRPVDGGAENGNALIEINTVKDFFIERFNNYNPRHVAEAKGPYDLVGSLCHEIGHNVFGYINPPDPWEDNMQTAGGMMNGRMSNGQVLRNLVDGDIHFAQKKYGSLPQPKQLPLKLQDAQEIDQHGGGSTYSASAASIAISGGPGSSSLFQVYEPAMKGKMVNAVNIKARLDSSYAVINRVEVYDGIIPVELQVLSFSTYSNESKEVTLKVGLAYKPVFKTGMMFRIEVLFLDAPPFTGASTTTRSLSITGLKVEEIPKPVETANTL